MGVTVAGVGVIRQRFVACVFIHLSLACTAGPLCNTHSGNTVLFLTIIFVHPPPSVVCLGEGWM